MTLFLFCHLEKLASTLIEPVHLFLQPATLTGILDVFPFDLLGRCSELAPFGWVSFGEAAFPIEQSQSDPLLELVAFSSKFRRCSFFHMGPQSAAGNLGDASAIHALRDGSGDSRPGLLFDCSSNKLNTILHKEPTSSTPPSPFIGMRGRLGFAAAFTCAARVRAFGFPDCVSGPLANTTVCDASATPTARAQALIAMFTTDELVSNTNVGAPGVPRLGVPAYQAANEALVTLLLITASAPPPDAFSFVARGRKQPWDRVRGVG